MSGIVRNTDTGEETSFREFSEKNQVGLYAISEKKAVEFYQNVGKLSTYMVQLGQMIAEMQNRTECADLRKGESMEELDKAISILVRLIFGTVGREEIDSTVKEVITLLESAKGKLTK